jgi:very-short-patch-repair endonuclease
MLWCTTVIPKDPFYRQKPIGSYVVDFFAPGQQMEAELEGKLAQLRTILLRISGASA